MPTNSLAYKAGSLVFGLRGISGTIIDPQPIIIKLQELNFIGLPLHEVSTSQFLVGNKFLQWITFMGCSPYVELEPNTAGKPFCHVRIAGPWPYPRLCYGSNTKGPCCLKCRKRFLQWRATLDIWEKPAADTVISCAHCGHAQNPVDLNWRREAGLGQLFIMVENIFPGEAGPVSGLLPELKDITGGYWEYFYVVDAPRLLI